MTTLSHRLVQLIDVTVPPRPRSVVVHSSPDVDDMTVALLETVPADVRVTLLSDDPRGTARRLRDLGLPVGSVRHHHRLTGLWAYLRSECSVSTHGLYGCLRRGSRKTSSTTWHGEPIKRTGTLIGRPAKHFDLVAVSSLMWKFVQATAFGLAPDHVHVIGTPRQSTLFHQPRSTRTAALKGPEQWVVFMPTYRQSTRAAVQIDSHLSLEYQQESIARLDRVVRAGGGVLWVRPHPLSDPYSGLPDSVRIAMDADLQRHGLTLYDMLAATDLLITDYSSVWVDFLITDNPVLAFCPDIEDYRDARGLALEPYEAWFPGRIARDADQLCDEAERLLRGEDAWREKRARVKELVGPRNAAAAEAYWSALLHD